jgi:hypothetical protein
MVLYVKVIRLTLMSVVLVVSSSSSSSCGSSSSSGSSSRNCCCLVVTLEFTIRHFGMSVEGVITKMKMETLI